MIRIMILLFVFTMGKPVQEATQEVQLKFTGIENQKGVMLISVFESEADYQNNKMYKRYSVKKDKVKDGKLSVKLKLPKQRLGIVVLDDENADGKMNYNRIRIPTEGFGFSNYESKGMSKPGFTDFDFTVSEKLSPIRIKMRYM